LGEESIINGAYSSRRPQKPKKEYMICSFAKLPAPNVYVAPPQSSNMLLSEVWRAFIYLKSAP